jgi:hypothetical protein
MKLLIMKLFSTYHFLVTKEETKLEKEISRKVKAKSEG